MNRSTLIKKNVAPKLRTSLMAVIWICFWAPVSTSWADSPEMANVGVATKGNYVTMDAVLTDQPERGQRLLNRATLRPPLIL